MPKVISGTKDRKKPRVIKGSSDPRQVRCTNKVCNNLIQHTPDGRGGKHYRCGACGMIITFTAL